MERQKAEAGVGDDPFHSWALLAIEAPALSMQHSGIGCDCELPACVAGPKAEVGVIKIHKIPLVEQTYLEEDLLADENAGEGEIGVRTEGGGSGEVFDVAEPGKHLAATPRLNRRRIIQKTEHGAGNAGASVSRIHEVSKGIGRRDRVVVEEPDEVSVVREGLPNADVAACGEAEVGAGLKDRNLWTALVDALD